MSDNFRKKSLLAIYIPFFGDPPGEMDPVNTANSKVSDVRDAARVKANSAPRAGHPKATGQFLGNRSTPLKPKKI